MQNYYLLSLIIFVNKISSLIGHGRLDVPPARSSAWREDPIRFPSYYDDNQMYCGGSYVLRGNGGRCGICGENINGAKNFEKGGTLYRGYSVRNYTQGQIIDVKVYLSANHLGWTEFRICNVDNMHTDATQDCLDKIILPDINGITRIPILPNVFNFETKLKLPSDLVCNHCVFQWKYHAGNSWNKDPDTGTSCLGCGPQEEFYGCADVSVFSPAMMTTTTTTQSSIIIPNNVLTINPTVQNTIKMTTTTMAHSVLTINVEDVESTHNHNDKYTLTQVNPNTNNNEIMSMDRVQSLIAMILNAQKRKEKPLEASKTQDTEFDPKEFTIAIPTMNIPTTTTSTKRPISSLATIKSLNQDPRCLNGDGYYADISSDCKDYYICVFTDTPMQKIIQKSCPEDLYFEPRLKVCNHKDSVVCDLP